MCSRYHVSTQHVLSLDNHAAHIGLGTAPSGSAARNARAQASETIATSLAFDAHNNARLVAELRINVRESMESASASDTQALTTWKPRSMSVRVLQRCFLLHQDVESVLPSRVWDLSVPSTQRGRNNAERYRRVFDTTRRC